MAPANNRFSRRTHKDSLRRWCVRKRAGRQDAQRDVHRIQRHRVLGYLGMGQNHSPKLLIGTSILPAIAAAAMAIDGRISAVAQCYQAKSTMMQNWKPPRLPRSINAVTSSVFAALRAGTGILLPLVRRTTAHIVRAASTPDSDPRCGLEFADAASAGWGDRGNKGYGKPKSRRALSRPILRRSSSLISQLSNQFAASA